MTTLRDLLTRKLTLQAWSVLFIAAGALILGGALGFVGVIVGSGVFMGTAGGLYAEREEARKKKKEAKTDAQPPG